MAINLNDKKTLTDKILPKVDFLVTSSGLQISCERITTPRILKFDKPGRCRACKADTVEISFVVSKEGVWVDCTRIRGTPFIPFDIVYDLPNHCIFRLKSRGHIFSIPYNTNDGDGSNTQSTEILSRAGSTSSVPPSSSFAELIQNRKKSSYSTTTTTTVAKKPAKQQQSSKFEDDSEKSEDEILFLGEKSVRADGKTQTINASLVNEVKQEIVSTDNEQEGGETDDTDAGEFSATPTPPPPKLQKIQDRFAAAAASAAANDEGKDESKKE